MSAIRDLQLALQETETAEFVTTMMRDISATRLQTIRAIFDANHQYYKELHSLMQMVKAYAAASDVSFDENQMGKGKVVVAVTANKRFYGQLNQQVMEQFFKLMQNNDAYGIVIGQTGAQILEHHKMESPVSVMSFASETPTEEEKKAVVSALHPYKEVLVVHPTFKSSFRQEPIVTDITHEPTDDSAVTPPDYICEPDIVGLLEFFRTQIRFVLFERVLLETRVALTGARLMKMQRARERARELVKAGKRDIHKAARVIESMHLLETFTGYRSDRNI